MRLPVRRGRVFISSLLVLCCLASPFQASASNNSPTILIGEVQWSGSSRSTADEWLELWNVSDQPVDVSGWSLVGASDKPIYLTSAQAIAPKQAILVANYSEQTEKTLLTTHVTIATSSLSLSNDHLLIELHDANGVLQDTAGNGTKPPAGSSTPVNASMIRTFTSSGWGWTSAQTIFSPSAADLGTPGICDGCLATTTNSSTPSSSTLVNPSSELPPLTHSSDTSLSDTEVTTSSSSDAPLIDPLEAALYGITPAEVAEDVAEQAALATTTDPLPPVLADPTYATSSPEQTAELAQSIINSVTTTNITPNTTTTTDVSSSTTIVETSVSSTTTNSAVSQSTTTTPTLSLPASESLAVIPQLVTTSSPSIILPQIFPETIAAPQISEIMAAPVPKDTEWIELTLPDTATPANYLNWRLEVDEKPLFTFTPTTIQSLIAQNTYLVLSWKSPKLKNTGAKITIKQPNGLIAQEVTYGTSTRGTSWIPDTITTRWIMTYTPTKGGINVLSSAPISKATPSPSSTYKAITSVSTAKFKEPISSPLSAKLKTETANVTAQSSIKELAIASEKSNSNTLHKSKAKATPKRTKTAKKTPKKSSTKSRFTFPSTVTRFENIKPEQLSPRVRVRLQGVVGSTTSAFGKQHFVLLAPDGRGLLVKGTTHQPSPILGETIELTGLLFANDDGIQLQMEAGDQWKAVNLAATSTPRLIDWNAPGIEDQWSLTRLEGLVTDSRATALSLESDIGEVSIPIKAILGYRAQRIKPGDKIEVTGIFDGRNGTWKIQPSRASDILLLKHPEPEQTAASAAPATSAKS